MIFTSRNESGRRKYDWIMSLPVGANFVTRRLKPVKVGKIIPIQPGRGKKAGAWAQVRACDHHMELTVDWYCRDEAELEGFDTYQGLKEYFSKKNIDICSTYRILLIKLQTKPI